MPFFRKILILFAVLAVCVTCLFSCSNNGNSSDTTTTPDTDAPLTESVKISLESYKLIRPDIIAPELMSEISNTINEIKEVTGVRLELASDFVPGNFSNSAIENDDLELLVGETNRKESRDAFARIANEADYIIERNGNKVVIVGKTDSATTTALRFFLDNYLGNGKLAIPEDLCHEFILGTESNPAYQLASQYTIIRSESLTSETAMRCFNTMRQGLESLTGVAPVVAVDAVIGAQVPESGHVSTEKEILIGQTNRAESITAAKGLGSMDYTIRMTENKIIIVGGSTMATLRGVDKFINLVREGMLTSLSAGSLSHTEIFWDTYTINPLCLDVSQFVPVWSEQYQIPDWLRDFDEKSYAITQNNLRNMSMSHRGDMIYYPENSIEGILSAIFAGADGIEIDISETKDHVLVLMHDETLNRTTDVLEKAGKNGLPTSLNIKDWTYDQLLQLNLKCNNGKQTEFKIPTYYEALCAMKGRCFICNDTKTNKLLFTEDIFAYANDIGCKEIFFYEGGLSLMKTYLNKNPDDADFAAYVATVEKYIRNGGTLRSRYWVYTAAEESTVSATAYHLECVDRWVKLRAAGKTLVWSNNIVPYCDYISKNFTAAK